MTISLLIVYFIASVVVGYLGRDTFAGSVGYFLLSCIFTPPIALFFLVVTGKKASIREETSIHKETSIHEENSIHKEPTTHK